VIDALESKGYAERTEHPYDRRKVFINLLPEGKRVARELLCLESDYLDRVDRQFTQEEMDTYRSLSGRIQETRTAVMQAIMAERAGDSKASLDA
jgi:DNA-binding MarR family transcriptional regulator